MLESYAESNGYANTVHFTDDGFSGGSFDRPGWKQMLIRIENGDIGTVIVKDMSRVGRDYLQVGFYTEVFFREKGIRFIAVSNGVDSADNTGSEFAPFLDIMNEWYLCDCSRKITAVLISPILRDLYESYQVPYIICYPHIGLKEEYKSRYIARGNTNDFINIFTEQWDDRIEWIMQDEHGRHIVLGAGMFLTDVKEEIDSIINEMNKTANDAKHLTIMNMILIRVKYGNWTAGRRFLIFWHRFLNNERMWAFMEINEGLI